MVPTWIQTQAGTAPPVISNGILQEDNTFFIMLEDGTSYITQE